MENLENGAQSQVSTEPTQVPVEITPAAAHQHGHGTPPSTGQGPGKRSKLVWWVVGALVVCVAIVGVVWGSMGRKGFDENKSINTSEYQAVFLTNGQVYFGKLTDLNNKYVTISSIYYLQVQQSQNLQQGTESDANSQVSLAKLGNELHGPEDKMHIAADQVLFWENLKNDSKVVQAIVKYQNR